MPPPSPPADRPTGPPPSPPPPALNPPAGRSTARTAAWLSLIFLALAAICALRLLIGSRFGWPEGEVRDIRLYRIALALIAGVALAQSGVALQALLRNPLAEPFILGLSSGAALGVMIQLYIGYSRQIDPGPQQIGALLGALATMVVVYLAGRRRGLLDPLGLILVGVVLSTINGALIMMLSYLAAGYAGLKTDLYQWMMGYLNEGIKASTTTVIAVMTAAGTLALIILGKAMDAASFSDDEASSLGVNLAKLRPLLFLIASALAAGAVVLAGPLAFVGLICPHLVRLMLGPGHRNLAIGSAGLGAALVVGADTVSVLLDRGQGQMPIGIFTAMIGGPVFLAMLHSRLGRGLE